MFRKEEAAVTDWSPETVDMCANRQTEILRSAAKMLAPGGRLVYSTCTFAPQENEGTVSRFLEEHPSFSIVSADAPWFAPGQAAWIDAPAANLDQTFRLWPHLLRGEGHYAAVLEKSGDADCNSFHLSSDKAKKQTSSDASRLLAAFCRETGTTLPQGHLLTFGQTLYQVPDQMPPLDGLKVLRAGLELGQILKNRFEPAHAWALCFKQPGLSLIFRQTVRKFLPISAAKPSPAPRSDGRCFAWMV